MKSCDICGCKEANYRIFRYDAKLRKCFYKQHNSRICLSCFQLMERGARGRCFFDMLGKKFDEEFDFMTMNEMMNKQEKENQGKYILWDICKG